MKTKLLIISLCLVSLVTLYGCSNDKNNKKAAEVANEKNAAIENQIVNNNEKNSNNEKISDIDSIEGDDINANNAIKDTKSYMGSWRISQYICACIGIYSQDEIESFIGKTVTFSDETANYFKEKHVDNIDTLDNPIYEETDMTVEEYLNGYKLSNSSVGLNGTTINQIDIMDENKDCLLSLVKDDNRLFIHLLGVFLELEKIN
ncbi:hypothetical protein [Clostridium butanoliproducens]|uniref:hypothetical protein n=1 Tax=Clostridium butanoliproducens TaxID=2991837 RepID=UPI0024B95100|nr:hypothetical protein [Clostridium butanoliproducens]MDU1350919.1 hypothetical protein [Clostridium argentinense]